MKKIYLFFIAAAYLFSINTKAQPSTDTSSHHCTVGYAMGNAVADNRAIIWRDYDWDNPPHVTNLIYDNTNSFLKAWGPLKWIGTSQESWYVFGGLNEKGLGCFNSLLIDFANEGGYQMGNYRPQAWILANCSTVTQVRTAIQKQIDFNNGVSGGIDYGWNYTGGYAPALSLVVVDATGTTTMFEVAKTFYYEYDPANASRLAQFPVQAGSRANKPHRRTDAMDNSGTNYNTTGGRRYYEARDHLIAMASNADKLSIQEVMDTVARWGDPGFDGSYTDGTNGCRNNNYMTQDATIIWGAAPGEDPLTATLFIALGNPDYSIFLPVWAVNGNTLSTRLTSTTTTGIATQAKNLYNKRADAAYDDYVNSFFKGIEINFREVVKIAREYWNANGFDAAMADAITDEAAETVYQTLVTLNQNTGYNLNPTPELTAINSNTNGLAASLSAVASDNGSIASVSWDFGDGTTGTGTSVNHTYTVAGTYLVRCRVQDNNGSRNSKWTFITVPNVSTGIAESTNNKIFVFPNPAYGELMVDLTDVVAESVNVSVFDVIGKKVFESRFAGRSRYEITLPDLIPGLYVVRIEAEDVVHLNRISIH